MLDGMPDGFARFSFTRTLRSVVDWRGQVVTMLDRSYLAEPVPTLLVWGEHDGVIPVEHAHRAAEALPAARLSIYEEAGHFPHHSDPDRFVAELFDFLDSTEPFEHDHGRWRDRLVAGARRDADGAGGLRTGLPGPGRLTERAPPGVGRPRERRRRTPRNSTNPEKYLLTATNAVRMVERYDTRPPCRGRPSVSSTAVSGSRTEA